MFPLDPRDGSPTRLASQCAGVLQDLPACQTSLRELTAARFENLWSGAPLRGVRVSRRRTLVFFRFFLLGPLFRTFSYFFALFFDFFRSWVRFEFSLAIFCVFLRFLVDFWWILDNFGMVFETIFDDFSKL